MSDLCIYSCIWGRDNLGLERYSVASLREVKIIFIEEMQKWIFYNLQYIFTFQIWYDSKLCTFILHFDSLWKILALPFTVKTQHFLGCTISEMNNYKLGTYKIQETITFRHFISCGLSLKIEPANDGYVGGPAGSPWSEFKQSLSVQGMCVCKCSRMCVYLGRQVFLCIVHLFLILSSLSKTTHKPPQRVVG